MNWYEDPYALFFLLMFLGLLFFSIAMAAKTFLSGFKEGTEEAKQRGGNKA